METSRRHPKKTKGFRQTFLVPKDADLVTLLGRFLELAKPAGCYNRIRDPVAEISYS
jgi:hypothetical protein